MKKTSEKLTLSVIGSLLGTSPTTASRWIEEGLIEQNKSRGKTVKVLDYDPVSITILRIGVFMRQHLGSTVQGASIIMRSFRNHLDKREPDENVYLLVSPNPLKDKTITFRCPTEFYKYGAQGAAHASEVESIVDWTLLDFDFIHTNTLKIIEELKSQKTRCVLRLFESSWQSAA